MAVPQKFRERDGASLPSPSGPSLPPGVPGCYDTSGSETMDAATPDVLAAALAAQATRLRQAATLLRRHAGHLTYHPVTARRPQPSPELLAALAEVEVVVRDVQQAHDLHRDHAAVDRGAQVVLAALEVLRPMLGPNGPAGDDATLDAPYGVSAPKRHHPGALCTIVAERVEGLAGALEVAAIAMANRGRAGQSAAAGAAP